MRPLAQIEAPGVREQARAAEAFLLSHHWCRAIRSGQAAWAADGVLGVFQFEIEPGAPGVDPVLWVVTGDLPPAYLVLDDAPTWREALEGYVDEMEHWVEAVRTGASFDRVIPVDVPPTAENAELLSSRLAFIRREILAADPELLESDV